ncbi:unnamed protein product [Pleuronectes platessa]|uniref:Uncharacterized protein n=1 Tax=Pleuronectes platessa TaxID=8262 RepID=A0A9N7VUP6_PLEPL|nr:unnamed protein product [Pleuronectes platessa]
MRICICSAPSSSIPDDEEVPLLWTGGHGEEDPAAPCSTSTAGLCKHGSWRRLPSSPAGTECSVSGLDSSTGSAGLVSVSCPEERGIRADHVALMSTVRLRFTHWSTSPLDASTDAAPAADARGSRLL